MAYYKKTAQRNEWWEFQINVKDPTTRRPVDIAGKVVTMVVRVGPNASDALASVTGAATRIVDAATGRAAGGGRLADPNTYYGTLQVGTAADGTGWPVLDQFELTIEDCP